MPKAEMDVTGLQRPGDISIVIARGGPGVFGALFGAEVLADRVRGALREVPRRRPNGETGPPPPAIASGAGIDRTR